VQLLYAQGALDVDGRLTTPLGTQMAEFPVDPMLSKTVRPPTHTHTHDKHMQRDGKEGTHTADECRMMPRRA
jgi:hypothetical protein